MHVLQTERLLLRRLTPHDGELLWELDSDPEVMRFLTGGAATPRDLIEREILPRFLRVSAGHPGFGFWAVLDRTTEEFLGCLSFRPVNEGCPQEVELGYRLRRAAWGRDYAAEGARALIDLGFNDWGVQRVIATTYEDNLASRRVMEKLGLTYVRSFRFIPEASAGGATYSTADAEVFEGDDVEYALTRADWERQRAARGGAPSPVQ